ncbi:CRISPR-associated protein Cas2 [Kosmotoga arenicorallina S304]|uniref:CRISPR-associated endoribonuclease Cas2 n=1 Tax=Kosmotoga arenicorallina S304 TaxID=1453497 RepID=A0A176K4K8_9BACT|nr:CRISPR-associated endonuclease Cas2 [Kosmotoga arenicorallina]OAA32512.1 CRISPR-associated protein Cas2 [Kosmotoga arenicorallina S304]
MKIILVYDVNEKRVSKVLKFLRKFLVWVQNSVFEGQLTYSELERLKVSLKKLINEKEDSVVIFSFSESIDLKKQIIGIDKSEDERTI